MARLSWVRWFPDDILSGVELLTPDQELAYRRILDYIAITKDQLPDDDRRLSRLTKMGRKWPRIKLELLDTGKIYTENGLIHNSKMSEVVKQAIENSQAQSNRANKRWRKNKT